MGAWLGDDFCNATVLLFLTVKLYGYPIQSSDECLDLLILFIIYFLSSLKGYKSERCLNLPVKMSKLHFSIQLE